MSSSVIRDPLADHLITPQNAALILIDYQPSQFATVRSMDPELLLKNIVTTVKTAKTFRLPIVHSTVNVASGQMQPRPAEDLHEGRHHARAGTLTSPRVPATKNYSRNKSLARHSIGQGLWIGRMGSGGQGQP
jgi:nicotinamidase-related amidase